MSALRSFVAACIQLTSRADVGQNLDTLRRLCAQAAEGGAELIVLPENLAFIGVGEGEKFRHAEALGDGPIQAALAEMARQAGAWLVAGGVPEKTARPTHVHNTCLVFAPDGSRAAAYRKIHLFDVRIPGAAEFLESRTVEPGAEPVVVETPLAPIGLSICYDVRFPELYRELARRGARVVVVPSAFTMHTGKDHWHALLRARAIENQVYVLAPAQFGQPNDKRTCYGKSLVVDPWGTVIAEAPDKECAILAEIDLAYQDKIRRELPVLDHRRI